MKTQKYKNIRYRGRRRNFAQRYRKTFSTKSYKKTLIKERDAYKVTRNIQNTR